jgi:hypothetical protein
VATSGNEAGGWYAAVRETVERASVDNPVVGRYGLGMSSMSRRTFMGQSSLASVSTLVASERVVAGQAFRRWRAAIIGCTGQGDCGHSLDTALSGIESAEVVGLADPNEAGRARAAQRANAPRQYSD